MNAGARCHKCDKPLTPEEQFCLNCGTNRDSTEPPPAPDQSAPRWVTSILGDKLTRTLLGIPAPGEVAQPEEVVASADHAVAAPAAESGAQSAGALLVLLRLFVLLLVAAGAGAITWFLLSMFLTNPRVDGTEPASEETRVVAEPPRPSGPGQLVLRGLPLGAVIRVDGRTVSGTSLSLEPGDHVVQVQASGYRVFVDTVTIEAGERHELPVNPVRLP